MSHYYSSSSSSSKAAGHVVHQRGQPVFASISNYNTSGRHQRRRSTEEYPSKAAARPTTTHHHSTTSTSSRPLRSLSLDPILAYHSHSYNALIEYDVALPPSQVRISSRSSSEPIVLSSQDRALPATNPPSSHLVITCEYLPWTIDIRPVSHASYVTVGDVLDGIYRSLRHHISAAEWNAASPHNQERLRDAYYRRVKRSQTHRDREDESRNGLRRIDWLAKNTTFMGLTPGKREGEWTLHVRPAAKTVKFWAGS